MVAKLKLQQPEPAPYLRIFVPGKPVSTNSMYTAGRGKNRFAGRRRTDAAIAWTDAVWADTLRVMNQKHLRGGTTLRKPLRIDVELYRIRANADPDNFLKATLDGLKVALGVDDRFYDTVTARRAALVGKASTYPHGAVITVWEAPG